MSTVGEIKIANLTPRERWWVWRRRAKKTQVAVARARGESEDRIGDYDLGRTAPPAVRLNKELSDGERCWLLRKRSGATLEEVANATGVSRVTVLKRERNRGEVHKLVDYWNGRGWV